MGIILKIEQLFVGVSGKTIIAELDLTIYKNEVVGIIAPNGTGKTTLFKTMAAIQKSRKGRITINGFTVEENRVNYLRQLFFFEKPEHLYGNLTAREHLNYVKETWQSEVSVDEVIEQLKMGEYSDQRVKRFSLGMKQHLIIGMYLVSDCPVLIFDEPLNGLDPTSVAIISKAMRELQNAGKSLLLSSHDLYNIEQICSRVVFMRDQKIVYDTTKLDDLQSLYRVIFEEKGAV